MTHLSQRHDFAKARDEERCGRLAACRRAGGEEHDCAEHEGYSLHEASYANRSVRPLRRARTRSSRGELMEKKSWGYAVAGALIIFAATRLSAQPPTEHAGEYAPADIQYGATIYAA